MLMVPSGIAPQGAYAVTSSYSLCIPFVLNPTIIRSIVLPLVCIRGVKRSRIKHWINNFCLMSPCIHWQSSLELGLGALVALLGHEKGEVSFTHMHTTSPLLLSPKNQFPINMMSSEKCPTSWRPASLLTWISLVGICMLACLNYGLIMYACGLFVSIV